MTDPALSPFVAVDRARWARLGAAAVLSAGGGAAVPPPAAAGGAVVAPSAVGGGAATAPSAVGGGAGPSSSTADGVATPPSMGMGPRRADAPSSTAWAGDVDADDRERVEVLGPLAAYAARRRELDLARRAGLGALDDALVRGGASAGGWVLAVAGGVASGKSTVARALADELRARGVGEVAHVSTDGFLMTNAELDRRGLMGQKGHPVTYDTPALLDLLRAVRAGDRAVQVPVYSHRLQDREPEPVLVDRPAALVLEGLRALAPAVDAADGDDVGAASAGDGVAAAGAGALGVADLVDLGVYVDAAEEHARAWYLDRFHAWRVAAADDEGALLHQIADLSDEDADAMALRVWAETNAPNVREHVLPTRARADVVLQKGADHRVERVLVRPI